MDHFKTVSVQTTEVLRSVWTSPSSKAFGAILLSFFSYLVGVENYDFLIYLGLLVVIDLITGIGASIHHGHCIESRKMFKTATKAVVYTLFVAATHLTTMIVPASGFLSVGVVSFLGLTEFFSIMENIAKMGYQTPKKLLNQKDIMSAVQKRPNKRRA